MDLPGVEPGTQQCECCVIPLYYKPKALSAKSQTPNNKQVSNSNLTNFICHSCESRNPELSANHWIPAFAGMTKSVFVGIYNLLFSFYQLYTLNHHILNRMIPFINFHSFNFINNIHAFNYITEISMLAV